MITFAVSSWNIIFAVYIVSESHKEEVGLINRDKIEQYISQHGIALTRLCLKLCRNHTESEDLYQETWCRVVEKIHSYDETKPFEPWLFTVCINIYKNAYKRAKNRPIAVFKTDEEKEWVIDSTANIPPCFNEEHEFIRQVISELDEKHRIVIVLHYFGDYSVAELASIIHIPQGTVKSRLYKAREIIRRRFEENEK